MNVKQFSKFMGQTLSKADKSCFNQALSDFFEGVSLLQDPTNDVCVLLDPFEVGVKATKREQIQANGRTWVFNDLLTESDIERVKKSAKKSGRTVHIFYVDTNYKISPKADAAGYRPELSFDATADQEQPRDRDHSTLCWNNNHGPDGILRDLSEENLITFSLVKGLRYAGWGSGAEIRGGINYCLNADTGADINIVSMSFGDNGSGDGKFWRDIFQPHIDRKSNYLFVASAGNAGGTGNPSKVGWPAKMEGIISSAAYDIRRLIASFSSKGIEVDVAAPGVSTPSRDWNNARINWSGTSSSGPHNAGILAIICLENETIDHQIIAEIFMEKFATDLGEDGFDNAFGHGATPAANYLDQSPGYNPPPNPEPPDDEPDNPPPPPPPGEGVTVSTTIDVPVLFRYRTQAEHDRGGTGTPIAWRVAQITKMKVQASAQDARVAYDGIQAVHRGYFFETGKVMVIPNGEGAAQVIQYAPMFWHYWSRNKEVTVYVEEVEGYDEQGRFFQFRLIDEKKGGVPPLFLIPAKVEEY